MKTGIVRNCVLGIMAYSLAPCVCIFAMAVDHGTLVIQGQGSLLAGGAIVARPGTFEPYIADWNEVVGL